MLPTVPSRQSKKAHQYEQHDAKAKPSGAMDPPLGRQIIGDE
jgi:hypothetical protein